MAERRCKAHDDAGFWWNGEWDGDPVKNLPGYVEGKGIFIPEPIPCPFVPQPDTDFCYKHQFLFEEAVTKMLLDHIEAEHKAKGLALGLTNA